MSRLSDRIQTCMFLSTFNGALVPEYYGLIDAQAGNRMMYNRVLENEMRHYERGYRDGITMKSIEELEASRGHDRQESHASLRDQAYQC